MIRKDDVYDAVRELLTELDDGDPLNYCDRCIDRAIDLVIRTFPRSENPAELAGVAVETLIGWELTILGERGAAIFGYE